MSTYSYPWTRQLTKMCRKYYATDRKSARILARQIARSEHHIRARPLLNNGKAWR